MRANQWPLQLSGRLLLAGDWHGSYAQAEAAIFYGTAGLLGSERATAVVQLGDFGIWLGDEAYLDRLNSLLARKGLKLYFVDGNHENFPRLYEYPLAPDGTRPVRENIFHLPRGYRLTWDDLQVLALGGAASIDRKYRRPGHSWWLEELITESDIQKSVAGGRADIMFCHDSPATAPNWVVDDAKSQHFARMDFGEDMLQYTTEHRQRLARVTDEVRPRILFHGHYHRLMGGRYRHSDGTAARVLGLDEGGATPNKSCRLLSSDEVRTEIAELDNTE